MRLNCNLTILTSLSSPPNSMSPLHPYGKHDTRVVSDLSRFEHEKHALRIRSRNPSPTSIDVELIAMGRRPNMIEVAEQHPTNYDHRDELFGYYAKASLLVVLEPERDFTPYPPLVSDGLPYNTPHSLRNPELPPHPPPKDYRNYYRQSLHPRQPLNPAEPMSLQPQDLPPAQDSRDFAEQHRKLTQQHDLLPHVAEEKHDRAIRQESENILLERVMNRPLHVLGPKNVDPNVDPRLQPGRFVITANNIVDSFQVMFGIIIIVLASVLGTNDARISTGIYRYFIAVGVIVLVVSMLFFTKAINFERRNGIIYCLICCVLTGVSLILSITSIATNSNCASSDICMQRKVLASFAILSFFLWMCTLVMYLTTLYISRMNLHEVPELDYRLTVNRSFSQKLRPPTYYNEDPGDRYFKEGPRDDRLPHMEELPMEQVEQLPKFYAPNNQILPPHLNVDLRGKKKMLVYSDD